MNDSMGNQKSRFAIFAYNKYWVNIIFCKPEVCCTLLNTFVNFYTKAIIH